MVDAGYLLRQCVEIASSGKAVSRSQLRITNPSALIALLVERGGAVLGVTQRELLRVYWYDGVQASGRTPQQESILRLPDVQLRAGTVNSAGQQKGVDALIIIDLFELALNRAVSEMVVVAGDADLVAGIESAQRRGIRVALLGIEDLSCGVSHRQSSELTTRVDRVTRIGREDISPLVAYQPAVTRQHSVVGDTDVVASKGAVPRSTAVDTAVTAFLTEVPPDAVLLGPDQTRIHPKWDRLLLHHVRVALRTGLLSAQDKSRARETVLARLQGGKWRKD
jgi:uncharacterized LabA/DUF88 family protein